MIGARIKCDHCGFIGEMEFMAASATTAVAPAGWASVSATVRIKGERDMTDEQRAELKKKVKQKTPTFHVCPGCVFGSWELKPERLLGHNV